MSVGGDLVARVEGALRDGPGLQLAVLFGSIARGDHHAGSDVDVGIVPVDPMLPMRAELELQRRLEAACGRPVHLVRLDRASTLLKWKVANDGRPLVNDPPHAWSRFVARSAMEFAELAPQLREAEERFRARLAGEPAP
jgi:predicted nucleotidyltransferase